MPERGTEEQRELIAIFAEMLWAPTGDGGDKRGRGEKPSWKIDPSHEAAIFSHLNKWKHGEKVDSDSGAHPLVHLAWRALAIAWQEDEERRVNDLKRANCPFCAELGGVHPEPDGH